MKTATHLLCKLVLGATAILYGTQASAAPITLNFTGAPYTSGVNGQGNAVVVDQGYTLTFSGVGNLLSQTSEGLGINSGVGDNGEIGCGSAFIVCFGTESLSISSVPAFTLYSIGLQQLFIDEFGFFDEQGWYSVNGGPAQVFDAVSSSGFRTIDFGPGGIANVSSLVFSVPYDLLGLSDYSVASLTVSSPYSSVPEPAMLLLFGSALAGVVARTRRKTSRTN